jgi:hypothetical protein
MRLADVIIDSRDVNRDLSEWVREISDMYGNRCGTVGGIIFDLRHELLPKNEWTMPNFAVSPFVVRDDPDQPKLWFPWFGPAEIGSAWPTSRKSRIVSTTESPELNHNEELNTPSLRIDNILRDGDKIAIEKVVPRMTNHVFEHQHDSEMRCAYLLIQRHDGTTIRPTIPLTFRGQNALLNANYPMNVLSRIDLRINEYFKKENSRIETKLGVKNTYATRALLELNEIRAMLENSVFYNAFDFVDQALFLGYLWAKAETEANLKPLAIAGVEATKGRKKGGIASVKTRRKKAEEGWIAIAKKMAMAIRVENPHFSQVKVAGEISFGWKDEIHHPGHSRLKQLVSQMERSGELPKRQRS